MKQLLGVLRGANSNNQDFVFMIEEGETYHIGKNKRRSNIRIDIDDMISDTHCVIATSPDSLNNVPNVYLTDTSTAGTFLNTCLIGQNRTVLLYSGCIISFASKHINLQYIQYSTDDELFPAFTMTIQPGYLFSPIQQVGTGREISIEATNREIGCGNQSSIMLAYDKKNPNRQLACKYTNLRRSHLRPWLMRAYKTELKILKSNKHPNVLSLVALHENQQQKFAFLPLYHGGSLQERLSNSDPSMNRMDERSAIFLIEQLFAGLDYLHDRDIIHCDLKVPSTNKQLAPCTNHAIQPSNILLADRHTCRPRLVIADFGHSMYKTYKPETWPEDWGTLAYHAPEMVQLQEFSDKVDSWAAGIIFYQLLVGDHPFNGYESQSLEEAIVMKEIELSSAIFSEISPSSKQIITQLTQKSQHQRAAIKQVVRKTLCSWFDGDDKIAHDHYVREREWWFGEVECPPSTSKAIKPNIARFDYDNQPEAVEMFKKFRNPTDPNTFLSAPQTDTSLYPSLSSRFKSFRNAREHIKFLQQC
ncbi:calmodulin-dependent protein kinase homologue [Mucor ambiguus]|uniref:Calmodulin-dependent protein kinase homologue n=1 Tax=Mucor ambiguus TaxID=91626 RepID=A0A0C9MLA8_9FUNG|nr:calmodulin-dependent protein kinase homologue [Mucor ambiguus]